MTKTEIKLLIHHFLIILIWVAWIAFYVYSFSIHFFLGLMSMITIPSILWFLISHQKYIPIKRGYFFNFLRKHSKEERKKIDRAISSKEYLCLGKAAFLEDYVLILNSGIIIEKSEILKIDKKVIHIKKSKRNQSYQITLTFLCKSVPNKQKYRFYCYPNEYPIFEKNYKKVLEGLYSKYEFPNYDGDS